MNLRYKDGISISDHLNDFQGCFDQLSSMGVKFDDEILGLWLLNTLLDSWETFRVTDDKLGSQWCCDHADGEEWCLK